MSMMNNASQATTTPDNDAPPENVSDVAAEFDAMLNGTVSPEMADDVAPEEPIDDGATIGDVGQDAPVEEEMLDEGEAVAATVGVADAEKAALRAELDALKSQMAAFTSGVQHAGGQVPQQGGGAQQGRERGEITIGEIVSPYAPEPHEEWMAKRNFIGLAEEPDVEFDKIVSSPAALNDYGNRIYRAAIRGVLQMITPLMDGYMSKAIAKGSLQQEFYRKNGDLEENAEVVEALAERIRAAEPHLTKTQFLQKLNQVARIHLKKQRPATKSGGTHRLQQQHGSGPQGGQRNAKAALAGGTGARRAAPTTDPESITSQVNDMRRAEL